MKQTFALLFKVAFLLLFILCSACSGLKISGVPALLSCNFEADAVNNPPDRSLPGDPAGDRIENSGTGPNAKVVQLGANKWLQVLNTRENNEGGRLSFRANEIIYPAKLYYTWRLRVVEGILNGAVSMVAKDAGGHNNVEIKLEDSRIAGEGDTGFGYLYLMPSHLFIGKLPLNQDCDFFLEVNHATRSFSLSVTRPKSAGGTLRLDNRPLAANSPAGTQNPVFEIFDRTAPPEFTTGGNLVNPSSGIVWFDQIQIKGNR